MLYIILIKASLWVVSSIYGYILDFKSKKLQNITNKAKVTSNLDNEQQLTPESSLKKKKKRKDFDHIIEEAYISHDIPNIENKNEMHESVAEPTESSPVPLRKRRNKSPALRNSIDALI